MSEVDTTQKAQDELAGVVLERYRRALEYQGQYTVHQGVNFRDMILRATHQYRREYTAADSAEMENAFGFCPSRYYGVTQQKVNATVAWNNDLIINNLDTMFTATPSPDPELDQASLDAIREGTKQELLRRMLDAGISDPNLLLDVRGRPQVRIENFLREQVRALKQVEQARIIGLASETAQTAQRLMRDKMIAGQFRQAYAGYTFERALYGVGYIKFPDWQRRPVLKHSGKRAKLKWETVPWFRQVKVTDFFPICDAADLQTNTGNTERTFITKAELINLGRQSNYITREIEEILETYGYRSRNWLDPDDASREAGWWGLDETIPLLIHEGFFSGDELREYGVDGVDAMDYVNAKIEVCGMRTIRAELLRMPDGADRSYFGSPFNKIGDNLLDVLGMGAMLWDSEQRVNRLMHLFEHNIDWATRPPVMTNPSVFQDPNQAARVRPGEQYMVEDRFAASGSMPEPIRPMGAVSAQYHLIMTQVGAILRQADEDCGIPAFAYGAQDFGRSSLGEYSQRMSNALRTIKQAALNEDIYFIEPAFTSMFNYLMEHEEDLAEGQDVGIVVRGMTGLLQEDQRKARQDAVIPMVLQGAQAGVVPEQAVQYAVRLLLEQAGFPVDALGLTNPVIQSALAAAAAQPLPGMTAGGPQVPALDGRSAVPAQNVAQPSGASNLSIPSPSL